MRVCIRECKIFSPKADKKWINASLLASVACLKLGHPHLSLVHTCEISTSTRTGIKEECSHL